MKYLNAKNRHLRHLPVIPVIYPTFIFILMLDIWVELYHRVSFPIYGVPYIRRRDYVKIDRNKLKYLNPIQKVNCMYCGYANGVLAYIVKIVGETEKYWCGIKHHEREGFHVPEHHAEFVEYGDREQYLKVYRNK